MNTDQKDLSVLGKITSPYGIHGWVKVISYTDPMDNILGYGKWQLSKDGRDFEVSVKSGKRHGKGIVVKIDGCDDRDQAIRFGGALIKVDKQLLPLLGEGEFYWHQLEGLSVKAVSGESLGVVDHLLETGSNDVLVVKATAESFDERERLIPYLPDQVVKSVDINAGVMIVDWDVDF